jgi:hypothetical protein
MATANELDVSISRLTEYTPDIAAGIGALLPEVWEDFDGEPMAREAAGGQALLRKAMGWINMWRPPKGLLDDNGMPYDENEVIIAIEKAKPKGVAKRGTTSLFFDWKKNRYYEKINGNEHYAFEHLKNTFDAIPVRMPISKDFTVATKENESLF